MIGYALAAIAVAAFLGAMFFAAVLSDRLVDWNARRLDRAHGYRAHHGVPWWRPAQHDHEERDAQGRQW